MTKGTKNATSATAAECQCVKRLHFMILQLRWTDVEAHKMQNIHSGGFVLLITASTIGKSPLDSQ